MNQARISQYLLVLILYKGFGMLNQSEVLKKIENEEKHIKNMLQDCANCLNEIKIKEKRIEEMYLHIVSIVETNKE